MYFGYRKAEQANGLTWDELADREPRLDAVLASAQAGKPITRKERQRFNYEHAFNDLRNWFEDMVGMYRRPADAVLSSHAAWVVVFARIFEEVYD